MMHFSRLCALRAPILTNITKLAIRHLQQTEPKLNPLVRNKSIFTYFKRPDGEACRLKDNMPDNVLLIYRNTMERYLIFAQFASTFCGGLICAILLFHNDTPAVKVPQWYEQPKQVPNEVLFYSTMLILICVSLQYMLKKLPLRVYRSPTNRYTFIFNGSLPTTHKRIVCSLNDIVKIEPSGLLPWKDCRFQVKDEVGVILMESFFRKPVDLNVLLGYEKYKDVDEDE